MPRRDFRRSENEIPCILGLFKELMTCYAVTKQNEGFRFLTAFLSCRERYIAYELARRVEMASEIHVIPRFHNKDKSSVCLSDTYQ